jgi:hypothetical protein
MSSGTWIGHLHLRLPTQAPLKGPVQRQPTLVYRTSVYLFLNPTDLGSGNISQGGGGSRQDPRRRWLRDPES